MSPAGNSTYHACARTNKLNPEDEIVMSKSSPTRHIENSLNAQRAKTFPRMNPGRRSLLKRAAQLPDPRLKPQHLRPQQQGYPISKKWRQPKLETSNFRVFSFFFQPENQTAASLVAKCLLVFACVGPDANDLALILSWCAPSGFAVRLSRLLSNRFYSGVLALGSICVHWQNKFLWQASRASTSFQSPS